VRVVRITPGTVLQIVDTRAVYGGRAVLPTSPYNFLTQAGSNDPVTFTLEFETALAKVFFTRPGLLAGPNGIVFPAWSATAYDTAGAAIDGVSEPEFGAWKNVPAKTFGLSDVNGVRSVACVTFDSDNHHHAAFNAVLIDDLVLEIAAAG
jgi:hypothetical protein